MTMSHFDGHEPERSDGSSADDLVRVGRTVEQALAVRGGAAPGITAIHCRPSPYQSSFALQDIDVWLADGSLLPLVSKATDWEALSGEALRARPRWLCDGEREHAVYRSVLSTSGLSTATYFGSYVTDSGGRHLLLERIDGVPLWQCGQFDAWCQAARWLARAHAPLGADVIAARDIDAHLLRYDRGFYEMWLQQAVSFDPRLDAASRVCMSAYPVIVDCLLREPNTFLHGDFYSSNVIVARAHDTGAVIRPVDWELAALGPSVLDLACLVAGHWADAEREALADAYYEERAALGFGVPPRDRYLRMLDYSLIHLSIRNLGWSREWTPPPDRAHDWLGEALRLCEKWAL